jgi:hypothetical protein
MKISKSLIIILLTIFLTNCSKNESTPPDCEIIPYFADLSGRMESRTLKGHILFSWIEGYYWHYAIVPNLNISAAHENVCEGNTAIGEDCLKQNLGFLAEGEEIFWESFGSIETIEGKTVKLRYPPENIRNDIITFCEETKLDLVIMY